MNKTRIEWVQNPDGGQGYTWNPITGCLNHINGMCKGGGFPCYAYKLAYGRLKQRYLANHFTALESFKIGDGDYGNSLADPFYPRFWPDRLIDKDLGNPFDSSYARMKPKGIFVCDMGELFGDWVPEQWQAEIFSTIASHPYDRFYLLTKQPQNLIKFSPFPDNCWVGVTVTGNDAYYPLMFHDPLNLRHIIAKVKYISFEPLLEKLLPQVKALASDFEMAGIKRVIIGACTGTLNDLKPTALKYPKLNLMPYGKKWTLQPQIEWVQEIVEAADKAGIPVFLKDNLKPILIEDAEHNLYSYPEWAGKQIAVTSDHKTPMRLLRQEMPE
ncbi:MAG TPA: DUF5131 family protein [Dehalococcoidia bacterium]|nr:DUF5131 family protein [Dehalococcoidia bacterium]